MGFSGKIVGLGAGAAVLVGGCLGLYLIKVSADASERRFAEIDKALREDFDRSAKTHVEQALSMLQQVANRAGRGEITLDQAKGAGADLLRALRYDKEGYFYADTLEGVNVVLLGRSSEGKSRWDLADTHGMKIIQEMNRIARSGGGFVDFWFPKKSGGESFRKRTYVTLFEPFGWVLGTGNYVDDIDAIVAVKRKEAQAEFRAQLLAIALMVLVTTVLAAAVAALLARSLTRPVKAMMDEMMRLQRAFSGGQLSQRAAVAGIEPEFRRVLEAVNEVVDAVHAPFKVMTEICERISHGVIPPRRTNTVHGEIVVAQQSLNRCIDSINALVADANELVEAAVAGRLSQRADVTRHEGGFREIVEGVNATLDAVLNPVHEAAQVLERLAQRDLKARVEGSYQGDHARIKDALNGTAEALHESLAQVAQAVEQVSSAAGQIAASSEAVAAGASEQASSLEETSASLESMASMTKQAADHAQQANGLAQVAQVAAADGSAAMDQMTAAMGKIKASAQGTSQIIKDINEIAFQTNLLALNAAVEAARAGEAGRGFAVVAEEVRSLALRSKEAANKTEELIRQSVKEAGEGEVRAKHVNERLGDIASSVTKVSGIIAEIAATAKEQAVGIDQVTRAVAQMNQVTQQNAASSEESSSAAAELSGQSEELAAMVGTFRLDRAAKSVEETAAPARWPPGLPGTLRAA